MTVCSASEEICSKEPTLLASASLKIRATSNDSLWNNNTDWCLIPMSDISDSRSVSHTPRRSWNRCCRAAGWRRGRPRQWRSGLRGDRWSQSTEPKAGSPVCPASPLTHRHRPIEGFFLKKSMNNMYNEWKGREKQRWRIVVCSLMCDVLGLGSNRSRLPAGRVPVCPSRSYLPAAHRTRGSSSLHWPTEEMRRARQWNQLSNYRSHADYLPGTKTSSNTQPRSDVWLCVTLHASRREWRN